MSPTHLAGSEAVRVLLARIKVIHRRRGRRTTLVAIDGYGGAGKTTLAAALADCLIDAVVVHTDDSARPNVPGWEWQRFVAQVLDPLLSDRAARYQRYDWGQDRLAEWHDVPVGGVVIAEGVSILRRELGDPWDVKVWIDCPHDLRLARGVARDGEAPRGQWEQVWMPEEDAYFTDQRPDLRADYVIDGTGTP